MASGNQLGPLTFAMMFTAIALAGCSSNDPSPLLAPSENQPPLFLPNTWQNLTTAFENGPIPGGIILNSRAPAESFGAMALQAVGPASSWLAAFTPLPEPFATETGFDLDITLEATTQDGGTTFLAGPGLVIDYGEGSFLGVVGFPGARFIDTTIPFAVNGLIHHPDEPLAFSYSQRVGQSYGNEDQPARIVGVFFAAASTTAWNVTADIRWAAGPATGPHHLAAGSGAILVVGAERTATLEPYASALTLTAELETGWHHLQILTDPWQPIEVNDFDFRLPGGKTVKGQSFEHGTCDPTGCSAGATNTVDILGTIADGAGTLQATLTFVRTDDWVDLGYVHLPLSGEVPELSPGEYVDTSWPFG